MSLKTERLAARGKLAELRLEARQLETSIQGDIAAVRLLLPPFEKVEDVKAEQAAAQCVELAAKHAEYLGKLAEIRAITKALG